MLTATEAHEKIEAAAKRASDQPRVMGLFQVGKVVRQGDIYLHMVAASHAHGGARESRQLAVGIQTNARHVAEEPAALYEGTMLPGWCASGAFLGPCIEAPARFTVSHPEHAALSLPAGTYQVTHQVDARTLERVKD